MIQSKTDTELKQLAIDIAERRVFTNRDIDDIDDLRSVFLIISLGAFTNSEEELKEIGLIYEYLSEAGPISVNGLPTFLSCKYISRTDFTRMVPMLQEYQKIKQEFINK